MSAVNQSPVQRFIHKIADAGSSRDLADRELLTRFARAGDQIAFTMLVQRHGPKVLGVCRRILGGSHDADDAFQATFLVLVRKAGTLKQQDLLGPWLYGVAVRTALRARSKAWKRRSLQRPLADVPQSAPTPDFVASELRQVLDEELNGLSPRHRQPILLCYLEGKTTEEAGRILGCPKGTVLSRLSRARDQLRSRLLRRGLALSAGTLAAFLPEVAAAATVSEPLMTITMQSAQAFALGKAAGAGAVSAKVAGLTKGVLTSMFISKLKMASALLVLVVGIIASGWVLHSAFAEVGTVETSARPAAPPVPFLVPADDQADLKALLDKGIQASGGQAKLGKFVAGTCTLKGTAEGTDFSLSGFLQGTNQFKLEGQLTPLGDVMFVVNGDQGWVKHGGSVKDAPQQILRGLKDLARAFRYVHTLTALRDKGVSLVPLGEANVEGTPALGLRVVCQDEQDIDVFLDKGTGHPLKAVLKIHTGQAEKGVEFTFGEQKEFEGRKHFTKVTAREEGRLVFEAEFSDIRWLDKLDASTFDRP